MYGVRLTSQLSLWCDDGWLWLGRVWHKRSVLKSKIELYSLGASAHTFCYSIMTKHRILLQTRKAQWYLILIPALNQYRYETDRMAWYRAEYALSISLSPDCLLNYFAVTGKDTFSVWAVPCIYSMAGWERIRGGWVWISTGKSYSAIMYCNTLIQLHFRISNEVHWGAIEA